MQTCTTADNCFNIDVTKGIPKGDADDSWIGFPGDQEAAGFATLYAETSTDFYNFWQPGFVMNQQSGDNFA